MTTRPRRRTLIARSALTGVAALGATGLVAVTPAAGNPQQAQRPRFAFIADAYGSSIVAGSSIRSGPTAPAPLPCRAGLGATRSNHVAKGTPPQLGRVGAVTTHSASRRLGATTVETTSRVRITALDLFGGALRAQGIAATATQRHSTTHGFRASGATTILGLVVNGKKESQHPKRNQSYSLPGIGSLTLNHQTRSKSPGGRAIEVDAMRIKAGASNPMGLPTGSTITIGFAKAALRPPSTIEVHGAAIGSESAVPGTGTTGRFAENLLSCAGTGGKTRSTSVNASSLPGAAVSGTFTSSVAGNIAKRPWATTRERAAGLDLLGGVVTANTVIARAHVTRTSARLSRSASGSSFGGLQVKGAPGIGDQVPANTKHVLPGIGTLYLHRITRTRTGLEVRMIELVLSSAQSGLPKGATITVGEARASITH